MTLNYFEQISILCILCTLLTLTLCASVASELYMNKLNFSYGINFKYNGLINHNIDRVWVVTRIHIPQRTEFKFHDIEFDTKCAFLDKYAQQFPESVTYVSGIKALCGSVQPLLRLIKSKSPRHVTV